MRGSRLAKATSKKVDRKRGQVWTGVGQGERGAYASAKVGKHESEWWAVGGWQK